MKVTVEKEILMQIANAVRGLPVDCTDFDAADQWVGIVVALENLAQGSQAEENLNEG